MFLILGGFSPGSRRVRSSFLKGTAFKGCGKTDPGGRPGIYPRHKLNKNDTGFSPRGMFFGILTQTKPFFAAALRTQEARKTNPVLQAAKKLSEGTKCQGTA